VRFRGNDYSVPTAYGHREVLVRGYVHEVVIACATEEIARHPRSYEREHFVFNPLHYLGTAGTEDRCARSSSYTGRLETTRRVRDPAPSARGAHGQVVATHLAFGLSNFLVDIGQVSRRSWRASSRSI
jgi:hypothetical protein